jgi:hypothetical protein
VPVAAFQRGLGEQASIATHCAHVPDSTSCTVFLSIKNIISNNPQRFPHTIHAITGLSLHGCVLVSHFNLGNLMLNQRRAERTQTTLESDIQAFMPSMDTKTTVNANPRQTIA